MEFKTLKLDTLEILRTWECFEFNELHIVECVEYDNRRTSIEVKRFFLLVYSFWVDSCYRGIGRNRIRFASKFSMILLLFICSSAWMEAEAAINICLLFFCPHSVIAQVLEVLEGSSRLSQPWTTVTWRQFLSFHLNSTKVFVLVFTSCCSSSA